MSFALTQEHRALRQMVATWVDQEVLPHAAAWDRDECIDRSIVRRLGELGLLGITVPEDLGGSGGDHLSYCLVLEELGRGDSSIRGIVSVSLGLVAKTVALYGTEGQRAAYLPGLCSGELLGCFALTEPGVGSDPGNLPPGRCVVAATGC